MYNKLVSIITILLLVATGSLRTIEAGVYAHQMPLHFPTPTRPRYVPDELLVIFTLDMAIQLGQRLAGGEEPITDFGDPFLDELGAIYGLVEARPFDKAAAIKVAANGEPSNKYLCFGCLYNLKFTDMTDVLATASMYMQSQYVVSAEPNYYVHLIGSPMSSSTPTLVPTPIPAATIAPLSTSEPVLPPRDVRPTAPAQSALDTASAPTIIGLAVCMMCAGFMMLVAGLVFFYIGLQKQRQIAFDAKEQEKQEELGD